MTGTRMPNVKIAPFAQRGKGALSHRERWKKKKISCHEKESANARVGRGHWKEKKGVFGCSWGK